MQHEQLLASHLLTCSPARLLTCSPGPEQAQTPPAVTTLPPQVRVEQLEERAAVFPLQMCLF